MTFLDDLAAANPEREQMPYGEARAAALVADITAGEPVSVGGFRGTLASRTTMTGFPSGAR